MAAHDELFGQYLPSDSLVHRLPVGAKYAMVFGGTFPTLLANRWWLSLAALTVSVGVLLASRLPWRRTLSFGWGMAALIAIVVAYQVIVGAPLVGVMLAANLLACLYLGRALTMTTPAPVLVDALVAAGRPLDGPLGRFGFSSERFGLAVGLMLRSIPYLVGLFDDVRNAARSRGLERNWFALVTPVIIGAVAYAQRTGDALVARGLNED